MTSIPSHPPPLKEFGTAPGKHLHPTIYKSEAGMLAGAKNRGGNREMFTVAVKIQAKHETHHVKVSLPLSLLYLYGTVETGDVTNTESSFEYEHQLIDFPNLCGDYG